jgi:PAS domain S-box-containing protein
MAGWFVEGLPGSWLGDAVLEAANAARIGVVVSTVAPDRVQNLYANDAACDILGWPREDLLAKNALDLIEPEARDSVAELRARKEPLAAVTCVRKDGTRVSIEFTTVTRTLGSDGIVVSFFVDATAKREAERTLAASEERLRLLVAAAPDGIVISRGPVILYANPAAARLLGHGDANGLVGRSFADYLDRSALETMGARVRAAMQGQKLQPMEYPARRADGSQVVAEITSVPIELEDGPAVLGFARDVTERNALRQQIARADRLASLGTLAAGVAHEINNPLTFVSLGVELLRERASSLSAEQREAVLATLDDIAAGTERIAKIVRELTTFSRVEPERAEPVDVVRALESAMRIVLHRTRHVAEVEMACPPLPPVVAERSRLEQVFVNLLLNAAQAFETHRPENLIRIESEVSEDAVAISVIDNGAGIAPDVIGRIFDPFFSTKPPGEGTGLGLALCHSILTRVGGQISATSTPGRTCLRVVIPRATDAHPADAPAPPVEAPREQRRVLIIDDDPGVAKSMRLALSGKHQVTLAESAEGALELLASGADFDAIVCDLAMPRMNGAELLERLQRERPEAAARFIFVTGGAITARMRAFVSSWRGPYLEKPFSARELERAIDTVLEGAR